MMMLLLLLLTAAASSVPSLKKSAASLLCRYFVVLLLLLLGPPRNNTPFATTTDAFAFQQQLQHGVKSLSTTTTTTTKWSSSFVKTALGSAASSNNGGGGSSRSSEEDDEDDDDIAIQWNLFKKHHAKGSWKGIWTSYDYMGDLLDETVASVDLNLNKDGQEEEEEVITQNHQFVVGATRSDCATCFDSMETKTIPVAVYTPNNLRRQRFAACGMVNGPTLLRSGIMATELGLNYGDGRLRVIFQHAPVWERDVEPGSCPPAGLKLLRVMVSREALRSSAPTAESETADPPDGSINPTFYRGVPPFAWHKKWSGTAWTWGPQQGNRGWSVTDLEEHDSWHGASPPQAWNMRLPGGCFVQAPRIVSSQETALLRLAWLPTPDMLLRLEAGVSALQPDMLLQDDSLEGFEPPSLVSLRCDVLKNTGDLAGQPQFVQDEQQQQQQETATASSSTAAKKTSKEIVAEALSKAAVTQQQQQQQQQQIPEESDNSSSDRVRTTSSPSSKNENPDDEQTPPDKDLQTIRDALKF